jgi:hypothetical protein
MEDSEEVSMRRWGAGAFALIPGGRVWMRPAIMVLSASLRVSDFFRPVEFGVLNYAPDSTEDIAQPLVHTPAKLTDCSARAPADLARDPRAASGLYAPSMRHICDMHAG